jgi:hypothetical protein
VPDTVLSTGVIMLEKAKHVSALIELHTGEEDRPSHKSISIKLCSNKAHKGEGLLWGLNLDKKVREGFPEEMTLS